MLGHLDGKLPGPAIWILRRRRSAVGDVSTTGDHLSARDDVTPLSCHLTNGGDNHGEVGVVVVEAVVQSCETYLVTPEDAPREWLQRAVWPYKYRFLRLKSLHDRLDVADESGGRQDFPPLLQ